MKAITVILLLILIYVVSNATHGQPAGHAALNAARYASATVPKHRLHEVQTSMPANWSFDGSVFVYTPPLVVGIETIDL